MEDSILEEILEKVISKTSDILDEKFAKFKHSFRNYQVNLRNDLNSVKELKKKELSKVRCYDVICNKAVNCNTCRNL